MGNFNHKVQVSVTKQILKLIRTYPFIVVLCFTTLLLKCNGDESSSLYVPRNEDNFKSSSSSSLNEKVAFQNEDIKLKNKRFRRNPLPEPIAEVLGSSSINSGSNFRISQEQVQNSHKPIFERCDEYQPSVEEESARGKISISYLENNVKMIVLIYFLFYLDNAKKLDFSFRY